MPFNRLLSRTKRFDASCGFAGLSPPPEYRRRGQDTHARAMSLKPLELRLAPLAQTIASAHYRREFSSGKSEYRPGFPHRHAAPPKRTPKGGGRHLSADSDRRARPRRRAPFFGTAPLPNRQSCRGFGVVETRGGSSAKCRSL